MIRLFFNENNHSKRKINKIQIMSITKGNVLEWAYRAQIVRLSKVENELKSFFGSSHGDNIENRKLVEILESFFYKFQRGLFYQDSYVGKRDVRQVALGIIQKHLKRWCDMYAASLDKTEHTSELLKILTIFSTLKAAPTQRIVQFINKQDVGQTVANILNTDEFVAFIKACANLRILPSTRLLQTLQRKIIPAVRKKSSVKADHYFSLLHSLAILDAQAQSTKQSEISQKIRECVNVLYNVGIAPRKDSERKILSDACTWFDISHNYNPSVDTDSSYAEGKLKRLFIRAIGSEYTLQAIDPVEIPKLGGHTVDLSFIFNTYGGRENVLFVECDGHSHYVMNLETETPMLNGSSIFQSLLIRKCLISSGSNNDRILMRLPVEMFCKDRQAALGLIKDILSKIIKNVDHYTLDKGVVLVEGPNTISVLAPCL